MPTAIAPAAPSTRIEEQDPNRRRWIFGVVFIVIAVAASATWWWLSTPRVDHGMAYGVFSDDHDILEIRSVTGPDMTVLPADQDGTATVMVTLRNDGRVPVTLLDVWPEEHELGCGWGPSERRLRTDPDLMFSDQGTTAPLPGASIAPGAEVAVYLEGAMNRPAECVNEALSSMGSIPVEVRVLGRESTVEVDLTNHLGWTDAFDSYADEDFTQRRSPSN